jgi:ribosomal-protein-alanine N-acetyltransferase
MRSEPRLDGLRTARLILARMRESDLPDLCRMHRDERVMATLGGVRSDEETAEYLKAQLAHWERDGFGWWILRDAEAGSFVGRGGLRRLTVEGREEGEVGYSLLPEFWGRGLATEVAEESVRIGFEILDLPDIVSFTLPTNRASRRVMEKAGLRYERDIVHADLPHVLYRLNASSWRKRDPSRA